MSICYVLFRMLSVAFLRQYAGEMETTFGNSAYRGTYHDLTVQESGIILGGAGTSGFHAVAKKGKPIDLHIEKIDKRGKI